MILTVRLMNFTADHLPFLHKALHTNDIEHGFSNQSSPSTHQATCHLSQTDLYSNAEEKAQRQKALTNEGRIKKKASQKRSFTFSEKWLLPLDIEITQRKATNSQMVTLFCWLCRAYGCERSDKKNKDSTLVSSVKNWHRTSYTDHIRCHPMEQHLNKFSEYCTVWTDKKRNFLRQFSLLWYTLCSLQRWKRYCYQEDIEINDWSYF